MARSDELVSPKARAAMVRVEQLQAAAVKRAAAAARAAEPDEGEPPFTDAERALAVHVARENAQALADEELDKLMHLLESALVETKARDQRRWSAGQPAGEPCPVCGLPAGEGHGAVPHQVADEKAEFGYRPCGCDKAGVGRCVRGATHQGICVASEDRSGLDADEQAAARLANPSGLVTFVCREDDSLAHPTVVGLGQVTIRAQ